MTDLAFKAELASRAAQDVREAEAELDRQRLLLADRLRMAQNAGATIQQLMDWTGYSRRMIFYLLKDKT